MSNTDETLMKFLGAIGERVEFLESYYKGLCEAVTRVRALEGKRDDEARMAAMSELFELLDDSHIWANDFASSVADEWKNFKKNHF